jgi:hypothetical protein
VLYLKLEQMCLKFTESRVLVSGVTKRSSKNHILSSSYSKVRVYIRFLTTLEKSGKGYKDI